MPLRNLKRRRLRSVYLGYDRGNQPPWICLYCCFVYMKIDAGSIVKTDRTWLCFQRPRASCFQRITRHNANYAQMPGCPLCSIAPAYPIVKWFASYAKSIDCANIHGFLRRLWIHRLRRQIHGLRRSTDCAQHYHYGYTRVWVLKG